MTELADRLKAIRKRKNITQKELCEGLCTRNQLSMIESGKSMPSIPLLEKLCERLGVSLSYIFSSDEEREKEDCASATRQLYRKLEEKNYSKIIEICQSVPGIDDGIRYIYSLALLESGIEEYFNGNNRYAQNLLSLCLENGRMTPLFPENLKSEAEFYENLVGDEKERIKSTEISFMLFMTMKDCLNAENSVDIFEKSKALPEEYSGYFYAMKLFYEKEYKKSREILEAILKEEITVPQKNIILSDLKNICEITGDYDSAFEYGRKIK